MGLLGIFLHVGPMGWESAWRCTTQVDYDEGAIANDSWGSLLGRSVGKRMGWDVLPYAITLIAWHRVEDFFSPMRWVGVKVSNRIFPTIIYMRWECLIGPSSLSFRVDIELPDVVLGCDVLPNVNLFNVSQVVALGSPLVVIPGGLGKIKILARIRRNEPRWIVVTFSDEIFDIWYDLMTWYLRWLHDAVGISP